MLIKHAQQDPYRWEDLLWPFDRLPAFHNRLVEFETLVIRLAQLLRRADGLTGEAETTYLRWLHSELQRVLHSIRVDMTDDSHPSASGVKASGGKKTAQQIKLRGGSGRSI